MTATGRAAALLREHTGRDPDGVWSAPGRVNLIGEHTDYNDGFVLPLAIDRRTTVAAARRDDGMLRCHSAQLGDAPPVAVGSLDPPGASRGWWSYVHGVAWALGARGVAVPAAELAVDSDVPVGAGLSSSAALEIAVALALCGLAGVELPAAELARAGQLAEWEWAGTPCGLMDQTIAVTGLAGHVVLLDTRSSQWRAVPFEPDREGLVLLVVDTRVSHALADGAYAERRRECERAARVLGVPALRDATAEDVGAAAAHLGPVLQRRARHVVTENARVLAAADLLGRGAVAATGPLLTASHASLRDDFAVSAPELDVAVDAALGAGAAGARMTGGGFGGSAIALAPAAASEDVEQAVHAAFAQRGFGAPDVFPVLPSDGGRRDA